jgi:hypothetical protein
VNFAVNDLLGQPESCVWLKLAFPVTVVAFANVPENSSVAGAAGTPLTNRLAGPL